MKIIMSKIMENLNKQLKLFSAFDNSNNDNTVTIFLYISSTTTNQLQIN